MGACSVSEEEDAADEVAALAVSDGDGDDGGDGGLVVVCGDRGLGGMEAYLLSGERCDPVVALTRSPGTDEPVLGYAQVRALVGAGPRIYLIQDEHSLRHLRGVLGRRLALAAGGARIWWPGLSVDSDPGDHPLVSYLNSESEREMLEEFERQFRLSHPVVRGELKLVEELRALAEHELAQAREQNRSMKIERHEALTRAEAAENELKVLRAVGKSSTPATGEHNQPKTQ